MARVAEGDGQAGQAEDGRAALAEALTGVDNTGERFSEVEREREKGTRLCQQSRVQRLPSRVHREAEEGCHRAIDIARRQNAKSTELRAVRSLRRLGHQPGKAAAARQRLADIDAWCIAGFATKD